MEDRAIVGGEFMLVKDRRIVFHTALGRSDKERGIPLERNSIYRIRSMTKPFTGTAILLLMEEGKLALDDRVSLYLPSWDNDRSREITIRQLLTHTSGLSESGYPGTPWEYPSLRALVDAIGEMGPEHPPGSRFQYSNLGSASLGAVAAEVSGMSLEQFFETRIFEPLGLEDTYTHFTPEASWAPRMNSTYWWNGTEWEKYWDNTMEQLYPFLRGAGGLYSTVFDYTRFLMVWMDLGLYSGGRLLSEETALDALWARPADEFGYYGYQWQIWNTPEYADGHAVFGHGGYNGTVAAAVQDRDSLILYFTQSTETDTRRLVVEGVIDILARSAG
ncbi:MAG: beta-lactamase family protein [Gemmatimonadota bacterium]|nr:MAG: beta-lactamase family protein [Gemmatimonadota bacterium]